MTTFTPVCPPLPALVLPLSCGFGTAAGYFAWSAYIYIQYTSISPWKNIFLSYNILYILTLFFFWPEQKYSTYPVFPINSFPGLPHSSFIFFLALLLCLTPDSFSEGWAGPGNFFFYYWEIFFSFVLPQCYNAFTWFHVLFYSASSGIYCVHYKFKEIDWTFVVCVPYSDSQSAFPFCKNLSSKIAFENLLYTCQITETSQAPPPDIDRWVLLTFVLAKLERVYMSGQSEFSPLPTFYSHLLSCCSAVSLLTK